MSFFEDYQEEGLCCIQCGQFIDGDEPGYPRMCEDCEAMNKGKRFTKRRNKNG